MNYSQTRQRENYALWLKIGSFFLYSIQNGINKYLLQQSSPALSPENIIFYQYAMASCILLVLMKYNSEHISWPKQCSYHFIRIASSACALLCFNYAIKNTSIADSIGIGLLSPLVGLTLSFVFLNERMNYKLTGILMLAQLSSMAWVLGNKVDTWSWQIQLNHWLFPFLTSICFNINTIYTKKLCNLGEKQNLLLLSTLGGITLIISPAIGLDVVPSLEQLSLLFFMASISLIAAWMLQKAIANARLNFLLPLGVCKYLLAVCFDVFIFRGSISNMQLISMLLAIVCIHLLQTTYRSDKKHHLKRGQLESFSARLSY